MKKSTGNSSENENTIDKNNQNSQTGRVYTPQTFQELIKNIKWSNRRNIMYNYYHLKDSWIVVEEWCGINFSDIVGENRLEGVKEYFILGDSVALYLCRNKIWPQWAEIIANNIVFGNNSMLCLSQNNIWDAWAIILADKLELKEWVTLDLSNNQIWYIWIEAIARNLELKKWVTLDLSWNYFWDDWAEAIARNLELEEWVTLDLHSNEIWDEWAKALMDNLELKQWVRLILRFNKISDTMKQKLKAREKSYNDRWIKCKVQIIDSYRDWIDDR